MHGYHELRSRKLGLSHLRVAASQPIVERGIRARRLYSGEDLLVTVKFLINGHTVAQTGGESITCYHVELAHHDILLVDGLPADSHLETCSRGAFENAGVPITLHPDIAAIWRRSGCAPLLGSNGQLERARLKGLLQASLSSNRGPARRVARRA